MLGIKGMGGKNFSNKEKHVGNKRHGWKKNFSNKEKHVVNKRQG